MGFAVPDRPREIRMEAAYFLQQLCQSRLSVFYLVLLLLFEFHILQNETLT